MILRNLARSSIRSVHRLLRTGPAVNVIERLDLEPWLYERYWWLQMHLAGKRCTRRIGGATVTFEATSVDEFRHYRTLVGEQPVVADLLARLGPGDVFWDVGAYVGTYTCFAADVQETPPVAFEPRGRCADRVEATLAANGLEATVVRKALAAVEQEVQFGVDEVARLDADDVVRTRRPDAGDSNDEADRSESVQSVPGDLLVERGVVPAPDAIKIDVEGAELAVLRGLDEVLTGHCRLVYCEIHPTLLGSFDAGPEAVTNYLEERGFDVTRIFDRGAEYFVRAEK